MSSPTHESAGKRVDLAENLHVLQLHDVILEEAQCKSFKFFLAPEPENIPVSFRVEVTAEPDKTAQGSFLVRLHVKLDITKLESPPLRMEVKVLGRGESLNKKLQADEISALAENAGLYLLWPYARTYAAFLTQSMGYPPLLLPLLRIPTPRRKKVTKSK